MALHQIQELLCFKPALKKRPMAAEFATSTLILKSNAVYVQQLLEVQVK